jgi:hypothetical protein
MFRATVEDVIERIRLTDIQFVPRVTNEDVLAVCVHCTQQRALYFRDFTSSRFFCSRVKRVGAKFLDEYSYARTSYANCVFLA